MPRESYRTSSVEGRLQGSRAKICGNQFFFGVALSVDILSLNSRNFLLLCVGRFFDVRLSWACGSSVRDTCALDGYGPRTRVLLFVLVLPIFRNTQREIVLQCVRRFDGRCCKTMLMLAAGAPVSYFYLILMCHYYHSFFLSWRTVCVPVSFSVSAHCHRCVLVATSDQSHPSGFRGQPKTEATVHLSRRLLANSASWAKQGSLAHLVSRKPLVNVSGEHNAPFDDTMDVERSVLLPLFVCILKAFGCLKRRRVGPASK